MSRARDLADGTFSGAVAAASGDFTGTIEAADLSDGTLTVGTEFVTNGSAKAWVNFNGQGTVAIRDSLNVASLTDNGVGDYTVNFSNGFGAANYCAIYGADTNAVENSNPYASSVRSNGIASGSVRIVAIQSNTSPITGVDFPNNCLTAHGDLA